MVNQSMQCDVRKCSVQKGSKVSIPFGCGIDPVRSLEENGDNVVLWSGFLVLDMGASGNGE